MSFAIEIHRGWRNLRVSETKGEFRNSDDADFARRFRLLKPRQQRILRSRAEGMSLDETARRAACGRQTVKNEMTLIYRALGVNARESLPRVCYLLGRLDGRR